MNKAAIVLSIASLALAGDASGHGRTGQGGYVSTVSSLAPPVLGVSVNVVGGDKRLRLSNSSGKTVVVLGNARSPSTASPVCRRVATGVSFDWHDRRVHWPASGPPKAVRDEPDKAHLVFSWRVPARADGKAFAIKGFLGYVPPKSTDAGRDWTLALLGGGGIALAALVVGAGARRRLRRAP